MSEIKGIIFDMDGVLIDSESISDITWVAAAKDFNIPMTMDILNSCRGSNKQDIIEILKKDFGQDFDAEAYLKRTGDYFWQIEAQNGVDLMPFVNETLKYLSKKYKLALASSTKEKDVITHLNKTGILQYFPDRMCGDMVTHSKPHPEIYEKACKLIGLSPSECVAIEDSMNGIKSAYAAGMKTIMVPDRIQPTEEIKPFCWKVCKSLDELKSVL